MSILSIFLATLVALEFFYIFYLETIATTSSKTAAVFGLSQADLVQKNLNVLFKNQGVYNACIGVGLLYSIYFSANAKELSSVFLLYIVIVAVYGGLTSDKHIIWKQGGLAILTLVSFLI